MENAIPNEVFSSNIDAPVEQIDRILLSNKKTRPSNMDITMMSGFLYAIIASPCVIIPSEWIYVVFGGVPIFQSLQEQEESYDNLVKIYNFIASILDNETQEISAFSKNGGVIPLRNLSGSEVVAFCTGYIKGYLLDPILRISFDVMQDFSLAFLLSLVETGPTAQKRLWYESAAPGGKIIDDVIKECLEQIVKKNNSSWQLIRKLSLVADNRGDKS